MSAPFFGPCPSNLYDQWTFLVTGSSSCSDITNAVNWVNEQGPPPWQTGFEGTFNTPSSVAPDSEGSSVFISSGDISSIWGTDGLVIKEAVLGNDPTVMLVAYYFDADGNFAPQQSCVYSGYPQTCGNSSVSYLYNLPVPGLSLCSSVNYSTTYQTWDASTWATFVEECTADPHCHASLTPGPCTADGYGDEDPFDDDP